MENRKNILADFYQNICDEDNRLVGNKHDTIEFVTTDIYVQKYLKPGSKIIEIGAGTGRYSLHYANMGYDVTAVEYVNSNLEVLKSKITPDIKITAMQGDAVDMSGFDDNTFDMTLVLGPLYHLYNIEDQKKAISEAIRITKKGGYIYIAYLTSDSIMIDWTLMDNHFIDGKDKDFDDNFKMINYEEGVFSAFYVQEFKDIMREYNVEYLHSVATDGMAHHVKTKIDSLSEEEFDMWLKYHLSTCERYDLQGYSNHMLYICKKN